MREIEIQLGEKVFRVAQLRIREEVRWRELARPLVEPIGELVVASGMSNPTPERMTKLAFTSSLFSDPLLTLEAICAYSPALTAEREWIEEHAYSDELVLALLLLFFAGTSPRMTSPISGAPLGSATTSMS